MIRKFPSPSTLAAQAVSLAICFASSAPFLPVHAEQQADGERITITGTRLNRIDGETASPVVVIDNEQIAASGQATVADILRNTSANSFGSRRQQSGYAGGLQNMATIDLRGLGSQRTLVLVNGRRVANSPALPDSQNLGMIPLVAVERIEMLLDGASSIYGSDAVGGVVNIILKRELEVSQLLAHVAEPEQAGGAERYVSLSGGHVGNQTSIMYALSHGERDAIADRDRELTQVGLSQFGFPASYTVLADNPNPSGPAVLTATHPDPRCPAQLGASTEFPDSVREGNLCKYNAAAQSNHIPASQQSSVYLTADRVTSAGDKWYTELSYTRSSATGTYAPTPQSGGSPYYPTMAADNPNNPTQGMSVDFDSNGDGIADTTLTGPFDLQLYYRNVAGGNRRTETVDTSQRVVTGVEGQWPQWQADYNVAIQHERNRTEENVDGLARRDLLQSAIDDGRFDLFAVNGATDLTLARSFATESEFESEFELSGLDASLRRPLFTTDQGEAQLAIGLDLKRHQYRSQFSDPFSGDLIDGRAGGGGASGERDISSAFAELGWPLAAGVDLNLAVRWDHYSDFGDALSPRLGLTWRAGPSWLWRASVGKGFRAPSLYELYSAQSQSFASAVDTLRCRALGDGNGDGIPDHEQPISALPLDSLCRPLSVQTVTSGNSELEAEDSQSITFGFVYQPSTQTQVHLSYFYQRFDNQITVPSLFDVLMQEADNGSSLLVHRDVTGQITAVDQTFSNYSGARAQGIDLNAEYQWQLQQLGEFTLAFELSTMLAYEVETVQGQGYRSVEGSIGMPDSKSNLRLSWQLGQYSANVNVLIIPEMEQQDTQLGSYYPVDAQFAMQTSGNGQITFGIRNLFDQEPPTSENLGFPYYIVGLVDITGRTPYLRYQQTF